MIQTHTAIQGVCAWPNLQQLPDGRLLVFIFNQPCHAKWEGDLDCWASDDGGETWQFHACPAPHKPGTNRMNCAVGFAANGDLIVLCSGWSDRLPPGQPTDWREGIVPLNPWTCRSSDGGRTWSITDDFPVQPHGRAYIPFGDISVGQDGHLRAFVYGRGAENDQGVSKFNSCFTRSTDDGHTWDEPHLLNSGGNETTGLHLGDGKWLAISREHAHANVRAQHVRCFVSDDDGRSWQPRQPLTLPQQINGHLLRLQDGRLAFSFTNRSPDNYGIDVRFSDDEGESWGPAHRLANNAISDCGYPSTIQRPDGSLVTAWYAQLSGAWHYEMRITRWSP